MFYNYVHQRLAYWLYKVADEYKWMNPDVVQDVLGTTRKEAIEYGAKGSSSGKKVNKNYST